MEDNFGKTNNLLCVLVNESVMEYPILCEHRERQYNFSIDTSYFFCPKC